MSQKIQPWMNKKTYLLVILFFCITLYWVELSPYSSNELKNYNQGYGTFDMKDYNADRVYEVMEHMEPRGFHIYYGYMIGDYLFILAFGGLQFILSYQAYAWSKRDVLRKLALYVPILRGIFDFVENTLLLVVLHDFPILRTSLVDISSLATQGKLFMIQIWLLLVLSGYLAKFIHRIRYRGLA